LSSRKESKTSLKANRILKELGKCDVTHIVWLPDSEANFMYGAMMSQKEIALVPVCREGEAIAVAMGLQLGGKKPVVLHQNTGLFESGDSLRGLALDLKLPLLLMIGYRGWLHGDPMTDSAGVFTEKILNTWGIKYYLVESDDDVAKISSAYNEAHETNRPVAILIGAEAE
jgi:sulfopyruvate decarboxylase subunit alpha